MYRRTSGRFARPLPPVPRGIGPLLGRAILKHVQPPEPIADLGDAPGPHPDHHPPAEPPPLPHGGVGADAAPEADHPAQPEADPDRAAAAPALADRPAR